jgi:hypothetical protein
MHPEVEFLSDCASFFSPHIPGNAAFAGPCVRTAQISSFLATYGLLCPMVVEAGIPLRHLARSNDGFIGGSPCRLDRHACVHSAAEEDGDDVPSLLQTLSFRTRWW